jgi:pyruvate,orthophosphate dikinase
MSTAALGTRYVYDFDEEAHGGRAQLGGKGIGLAEMTDMGLPVPSGFTVTTDACRAFMERSTFPAGLGDELKPRFAGSRHERASGSARPRTRSSSRFAPEPPSRCQG